MKHAKLYSDLLQAAKGQHCRWGASVFASAVTHYCVVHGCVCGGLKGGGGCVCGGGGGGCIHKTGTHTADRLLSFVEKEKKSQQIQPASSLEHLTAPGRKLPHPCPASLPEGLVHAGIKRSQSRSRAR